MQFCKNIKIKQAINRNSKIGICKNTNHQRVKVESSRGCLKNHFIEQKWLRKKQYEYFGHQENILIKFQFVDSDKKIYY